MKKVTASEDYLGLHCSATKQINRPLYFSIPESRRASTLLDLRRGLSEIIRDEILLKTIFLKMKDKQDRREEGV